MAIDDNTIYGLSGAQIKDLPGKVGAVKGKTRALTSTDYNWPTANPDGVALWLLEPGVYQTTTEKVYFDNSDSSQSGSYQYIIGQSNNGSVTRIFQPASGTTNATTISNGSKFADNQVFLRQSSVINSLTSTATNRPLSANQGKVLKGLVDSLAFKNSGAPTISTVGTVGQLLEDTTNGKLYICTAADTVTPSYTWAEVGAGGGSGVTELTSADYNYPTNNPSGIAMWLLDEGQYTVGGGVKLYSTTSNSKIISSGAIAGLIVTGTANGALLVDNTGITEYRMNADGIWGVNHVVLTSNKIQSSAGDSQTDIMSQNATTSMVFADPSTRYKVLIGGNNANGTNAVAVGRATKASGTSGIAIGSSAQASASGSVAIGANSQATTAGQFDISNTGGGGYNSSNYRLLTGLYDPQNAHDAATKGYVDTSINTAIGSIVSMSYEVVDILPASGELGVIYLLPSEESDPSNVYLEYLWVLDEESGDESGVIGHFELIGSTQVDLSNYVTNSDLQTTLNSYVTSSSLSTVATSGSYADLSNKPTVPTITMTTTDPGEGSALAADHYVGVYGGDPIIMDYSTVEVNTGTKWIDGSIIYKKTLAVPALSTDGSYVTKDIDETGVSKIVKFEGVMVNPGETGFWDISCKGVNIEAGVQRISIYNTSGLDLSTYKAYVTIYYTKSS